MPKIEEHKQRSLDRYGVDGGDIHSWMDEPCAVSAGHHRKYRHDQKDFDVLPQSIKDKYGDKSLQIFLDHIVYDNDKSPTYHNKRRWTIKELFIVEQLVPLSLNKLDLMRRTSPLIPDRSPQSILGKITKLGYKPSQKKICKTCNKEFDTTLPQQDYCSKQCMRTDKRRKNIEVLCLNCGRGFIGSKHRQYCCKECGIEARRKLKNERLPPEIRNIICKQCGKTYEKGVGGNKFCNNGCMTEWYKEHRHITKTCRMCSKPFDAASPYTTICKECNNKIIVDSQLTGGPTREFGTFILLFRDTEPEVYSEIKKAYNETARRGKNGKFYFDKYLAEIKAQEAK